MRRDFSSNVSHEMKTPLQVISGYAELMKNDMVQPADRQKFAALIYDEAQTMRSLINDVLTLSKPDESAFDDEGAPAIDFRRRRACGGPTLPASRPTRGVEVRVEGAPACIAGQPAPWPRRCCTTSSRTAYATTTRAAAWSMRVEAEPPARPGSGLPGEDAAGQVVVRVSDTGPGISPRSCARRCSSGSSAWTRAARRRRAARAWAWPS